MKKFKMFILFVLFLYGLSLKSFASSVLVKVWDKTFGGSRDYEANSIIETGDGGYLVAGDTWSYGNGKSDAWIIKIDKNGNKIWDKTFGGSDWDEAYSIIETKDGGYLVAGKTWSYGNGRSDAWIIKLKPIK